MSTGLLLRALAAATLLVVGPAGAPSAPRHATEEGRAGSADSAFVALVTRLSEPGGFFDSDNLISNEASYLHPLGRLRALGTTGGAYLGVGPDQNFSYIAHVRPRIAIIIDIRRDNLLQQLLYKATFSLAPTRAEFLALLFGRMPPTDPRALAGATPDRLLDWVEAQPTDAVTAASAQARVLAAVRAIGLPLDARDTATIRRFHAEFIENGPSLRYTSIGRPPRPFYPTYRQLVTEHDLQGRQASFLAREEDYRWLRDFQARGLVVPVVGNLAGDKALPEIARYLRERGDSLSVFYASNVEQYLFRDGIFPRWAENLLQLPRTPRSAVIRSYFGRQWSGPHPNAQPGYFSVQLVQRVDAFAEQWKKGALTDYWALVTEGVEAP